MNVSEIKRAMLAYLSAHYEEHGSGLVEIAPLAKQLAVPFGELMPALTALCQQGIVQSVVGGAHAALTPEGVRVAVDNDPGVPRQPPQTINFNAPVTQSAVAFNRGSASVSLVNVRVTNAISQIEQAIENVQDIPPEKKASWKQTLLELSKHPAIAAVLPRRPPQSAPLVAGSKCSTPDARGRMIFT